MKNLIIVIFILALTNSFSQEYRIIQTKEYASCADYAIYQKVALPEIIFNALECPPWVDIQDNLLTVVFGNDVLMYNFQTKIYSTLFTMFDEMDGMSAPAWSPDKKKQMFVIINQQRKHGYEAFARIIVLSFDEKYEVISKEKFDRPVNFYCASICTSTPNEDFYFIDNNTIGYKRHENIEERPAEKETIKLKK